MQSVSFVDVWVVEEVTYFDVRLGIRERMTSSRAGARSRRHMKNWFQCLHSRLS
jgi:hypothetical protein